MGETIEQNAKVGTESAGISSPFNFPAPRAIGTTLKFGIVYGFLFVTDVGIWFASFISDGAHGYNSSPPLRALLTMILRPLPGSAVCSNW